jgi:hypothetical protein
MRHPVLKLLSPKGNLVLRSRNQSHGTMAGSNSPPPWSRRSKRKPPTAGSGLESRRSALPPSWPKAPRAALSRPSAPPRRPCMPRPAPSAASCATPTSSSSPPTAPPPRSSGPDNATRPSPWVASRHRCRSWAGRRRADHRLALKLLPSQLSGQRALGYVCSDESERIEFLGVESEITAQTLPPDLEVCPPGATQEQSRASVHLSREKISAVRSWSSTIRVELLPWYQRALVASLANTASTYD